MLKDSCRGVIYLYRVRFTIPTLILNKRTHVAALDAFTRDFVNMASDNTPPDPRQEILEYLGKHPYAADTVDGIILYWLSRQRYETARDIIEKALDDLVEGGIVESVSTGTEKKVFRLAQDQRRPEPSREKQKSD